MNVRQKPDRGPLGLLVVLTLALVLAAGDRPARADDDPVETTKKALADARAYFEHECYVKGKAKLDQVEKQIAALGEFDREQFADEVHTYKEQLTARTERRGDDLASRLDRMLSPFEEAAKSTREPDDLTLKNFDENVTWVKEMVSDAENKALLGDERAAKYGRKLDWLHDKLGKAQLKGWLDASESYVKRIQDVLDGKDDHASTETVLQWFRYAGESLAKCPKDEPRAKQIGEKLAAQKNSFDAQQMAAEHDAVIKPAVEYWKYIQETYAGQSQGWEGETTPPTLKEFIQDTMQELNCPKTQSYCSEVLSRFFNDDRIKNAYAKFPEDPAFKKTVSEVVALREKAGGKILGYVKTCLDEAEKLAAGEQRETLKGSFGNLKNLLGRTTKGCAAYDATIARIDSLEKRWDSASADAEAARALLEKKLIDAANAAWPDMTSPWSGKWKKVDAPAAINAPKPWLGTVVHFSGGARGVNLNRSGWTFEGKYDFIVEVDGVPVCGNFDAGLAEAIKAVEKETGQEQINCEECVGIIDGTCKVYERVKHPFDDRYIRGRQIDGVRMRIVAWKACNVAAACGKGTNLAKVPGFKPIDCPERGQMRGD